jgi:hypothetical protein
LLEGLLVSAHSSESSTKADRRCPVTREDESLTTKRRHLTVADIACHNSHPWSSRPKFEGTCTRGPNRSSDQIPHRSPEGSETTHVAGFPPISNPARRVDKRPVARPNRRPAKRRRGRFLFFCRANGEGAKLRGQGLRAEVRAARGLPAFEARDAGRVTPSRWRCSRRLGRRTEAGPRRLLRRVRRRMVRRRGFRKPCA